MSQGWANAFGKTTQLDEEVANITVDPKNRINSGNNKHIMVWKLLNRQEEWV